MMRDVNWRRLISLDALSSRDRRALRIGLLFVVPALAFVGVVRPYRAALIETRNQVAAERQLLERELALIATRKQLPVTLENRRKSVQRAEGMLVKAANMTSAETRVTELLEQIASLSRVLLQEVRSAPVTREQVAPEGMQPLRLTVRGESDLEGVVTYLQRIERSPLMLRIKELSIERAPPPRQPARGRGARPSPPPQLNVMLFSVVVEAYAPATSTTAEELP
jgi:hypothetical protein